MNTVVSIDKSRGFTRMDNQLMEALATVDLPARELRVVIAIARQTLGYQEASRRLSADEIGKLTNMRRDVTSKAISHLLERRILFRVGGSRGEIGVSPVTEWVFYEAKPAHLTETKTSHSDNVVSLVKTSSETKTATSLLYTKKQPLVTVPSEQITAPQGAEPAADEAPLVSFDGEDFQVDPSLITKWAKAYAPVDIETEIVRAAAWASANRPKKDWRRFLVKWLGRAAAKAGNGVSEAGVPVDQIIDLYHQTCTSHPKVTVATDTVLRSMIVERWNESPDQQSGRNFWLPFFQKAANRSQVFFRGQNVQPRLEALMSRAVFREIAEAAQ